MNRLKIACFYSEAGRYPTPSCDNGISFLEDEIVANLFMMRFAEPFMAYERFVFELK